MTKLERQENAGTHPSRLIDRLRKLRASSGLMRKAHMLLREPYYRACEMIYPRGAPTRLSDGTPVRLHPRLLGMSPELYEPAVTALLCAHLREGSNVVDVGAHVGLHTLLFSRRVGMSGKVVAVEPSPSVADLLRRHLVWNACRNVAVVEAAAGDRKDMIDFCYRVDPTDPGGFASSIAYDIGGPKQPVPMTTLDAICRDLVPHLVKIDVEGAELSVLQGAEKLFARASPVLLVAVHPEPMRAMGASPRGLVAFLEARGYSGQHLDGRPAVEPGFEEILFQRRPV